MNILETVLLITFPLNFKIYNRNCYILQSICQSRIDTSRPICNSIAAVRPFKKCDCQAPVGNNNLNFASLTKYLDYYKTISKYIFSIPMYLHNFNLTLFFYIIVIRFYRICTRLKIPPKKIFQSTSRVMYVCTYNRPWRKKISAKQ